MISNALDIDFIQSDIHDRSCKNVFYWTFSCVTGQFIIDGNALGFITQTSRIAWLTAYPVWYK